MEVRQIIVSIIVKNLVYSGYEGIFIALTIGAIMFISAAIAGDISQPINQEIAQLVGVLYVINSSNLPALQATLMSIILKTSFGGNLDTFNNRWINCPLL